MSRLCVAVVSLLIETNSVLLHIRQLLLLSGQRNRPGSEITAACPSVTFSLTSWLNLGTSVARCFSSGSFTKLKCDIQRLTAYCTRQFSLVSDVLCLHDGLDDPLARSLARSLLVYSERTPRHILMIGTAGLSLISTMNIAVAADTLTNVHSTSNIHWREPEPCF